MNCISFLVNFVFLHNSSKVLRRDGRIGDDGCRPWWPPSMDSQLPDFHVESQQQIRPDFVVYPDTHSPFKNHFFFPIFLNIQTSKKINLFFLSDKNIPDSSP
ncbi:hypothetical protein NPIL_61171 [Nephila pilipes]|uniref:Uncharacterized protein n=1 Tax=Nephila pilipes TaxID=299642 RepID=A0A8X6P480_NEPPI|nr:hypothetical protein NPIL_61171 [Nephila pilipes]